MCTHDFLKDCLFPFLAGESRTVEVGWAPYDLADARVFRWSRPQSFLLMLGVQQSTHAQQLPISLELGCEISFGEVEPVWSGRVLGWASQRAEVQASIPL